MPWVVDTCILLDIGLDDPLFAASSENLLTAKLSDGLLICPITFIELAPAFAGHFDKLEGFLWQLGIDCQEDWCTKDTRLAATTWMRYVKERRVRKTAKRPIADVLIGAFAQRHQGLLTRNVQDFCKLFPSLKIIEP